jgi:hypothetical protein
MPDPAHTPGHNVRMSNTRWRALGAATGARGRSAWINQYVDAVLADPALHHTLRAVAAGRGLDVGDAINAAVGQWCARQRRHLTAPTDTDTGQREQLDDGRASA